MLRVFLFCFGQSIRDFRLQCSNGKIRNEFGLTEGGVSFVTDTDYGDVRIG